LPGAFALQRNVLAFPRPVHANVAIAA
jgi:hypothetical protein